MTEYYYITFNFNRELFYDGYIMRTDNHIIGYTDNSLLAGDGDKIEEYETIPIKVYGITSELFEENTGFGGFTAEGCINYLHYVIRLKKVENIDKEAINDRIDRILPKLPPQVQQIFIDKYLQKG